MLVYGSMVFGGFGPSTPWYEELMTQAETISAWIMERCQRDCTGSGWHRRGHLTPSQMRVQSKNGKPLLLGAFRCCQPGSIRQLIRLACVCQCLAENPDQWAAAQSRTVLLHGRLSKKPTAVRFLQPVALPARRSRTSSSRACPLERHQKVAGAHRRRAGRESGGNGPTRIGFDIPAAREPRVRSGYGAGIHSLRRADDGAFWRRKVFFRSLAQKVHSNRAGRLPLRVRLQPGLRGLRSLPLRLTRK